VQRPTSPIPASGGRDAGLQSRLSTGLAGLGVPAPVDALLDYVAELAKWNAAYNLTAVRDPGEMVTRHLLDSLALMPALRGGRVLDVGSGAGLPGIPLAIARPDWQFTLLDSNGKKVRFLRHLLRTRSLPNVEVVEARVEDYRPAAGFDAVVSRAFASLAEFFDKTAHLLAPGGQWVAMKGKLDARERAEVPARFRIQETRALSVPGLNEQRHAVIAIPA
jgi:16S rRNA (guanine527-N7)-methyltransferase